MWQPRVGRPGEREPGAGRVDDTTAHRAWWDGLHDRGGGTPDPPAGPGALRPDRGPSTGRRPEGIRALMLHAAARATLSAASVPAGVREWVLREMLDGAQFTAAPVAVARGADPGRVDGVRMGRGGRLHGRVSRVPQALVADYALLVSDAREFAVDALYRQAFVVSLRQPGVRVARCPGGGSVWDGAVGLDGVPAEHLLLTEREVALGWAVPGRPATE